jgi:DNA repair protein RadA/Sms
MGFCPQCGLEEPLVEGASRSKAIPPAQAETLATVLADEPQRATVGLPEVDRVLGGGLVAGSVVLVGGEPGVGKSTLLLQVAASLVRAGGSSLIVTAEESAQQVGLRARRLGVTASQGERLYLIADPDVDRVVAAAEDLRPDLVVIDSIQSVLCTDVEGAAGGVAQVRESAARFLRLAKTSGSAVVMVGHVTKEGGLAGPKLLEHMVDVVLGLEGDPDLGLRVLRAHKNRFGATHVAGMFEMSSDGLSEVIDPSKAFLADWRSDVPGTVVFPAVEGRRSITVEVQALGVPNDGVHSRRSVRGFEPSRLHQLLAVLQRHTAIKLGALDVYVNVVGGWQIDEPACDLPIALAIVSSVRDQPLGATAAWGEIGLGGEVRPVSFHARREEEARRIGVERIVAGKGGRRFDLRSALLRAELW